jgi:hypothetical protein
VVVSENNGVFVSRTGEVSSPKKYENTIFRNIRFVDSLPSMDQWKEPSFEYTPISYKFDNNLYLEGQFQSEKYFLHNREKILELFRPSEKIETYLLEKYGKYFSNSVSLHIRRGDYTVSQEFHPLCGMEYYKNALQYMNSAHHIENIMVIADDIAWTKEKFDDPRITFVEGEEDYIDLYIMTKCKHNIIANSSFSWWGAWLNENDTKTVIAPRQWFGPALQHNTKDLLSSNWIVL